jgi:Flp pilus assembly protein CpaB
LVLIGVILFIAGGAIAFSSVESANKSSSSSTVAAPVTSEAVVAKSDIPAGTTGQEMVSQGLVALELVPAKSYNVADLQTLQGLTDEVLTSAVAKGHAVTSTELSASTSSISLPTGMDASTVTLTGSLGLAGYLQPGARVDVYANITKVSTNQQNQAGASATLMLPCTELAMGNIEVLDVQSTSPSFSSHPSSTGRTIPASETLLLAVSPAQSRTLGFLSQDESISVVQTQQDASPPPVGACIGTNQTASAP